MECALRRHLESAGKKSNQLLGKNIELWILTYSGFVQDSTSIYWINKNNGWASVPGQKESIYFRSYESCNLRSGTDIKQINYIWTN